MKKFDPQSARNPDLTTNPAHRFILDDTEEEGPYRPEKATAAKTAPKTADTKSRTPWNTTKRRERRERQILLYTTDTIADALKAAKERTGKSANQLVNEILEQALRDAGYLGGE